jgi:hypothetical protein
MIASIADVPTLLDRHILARPLGDHGATSDDWLEVDIDGLKASGIETVVSLLELKEVVQRGLQREAELCQARGIEFTSFPIAGRGVPGCLQSTAALAESIGDRLSQGRSIAISLSGRNRPLVAYRDMRPRVHRHRSNRLVV